MPWPTYLWCTGLGPVPLFVTPPRNAVRGNMAFVVGRGQKDSLSKRTRTIHNEMPSQFRRAFLCARTAAKPRRRATCSFSVVRRFTRLFVSSYLSVSKPDANTERSPAKTADHNGSARLSDLLKQATALKTTSANRAKRSLSLDRARPNVDGC